MNSVPKQRRRFLDWIHEVAETEEKAELRQRIRNLERENEYLRDSEEQETVEAPDPDKAEFEKDTILSNEAGVLSENPPEATQEHSAAASDESAEHTEAKVLEDPILAEDIETLYRELEAAELEPKEEALEPRKED